MKFCNNSNFTLPKQSQRCRSVLEDGSRSLGLFWTEKSPSYNRRNTVNILSPIRQAVEIILNFRIKRKLAPVQCSDVILNDLMNIIL